MIPWSAKIKKNIAVYRYKGAYINEIITLFGIISVESTMPYDEVNGANNHFPVDFAFSLKRMILRPLKPER